MKVKIDEELKQKKLSEFMDMARGKLSPCPHCGEVESFVLGVSVPPPKTFDKSDVFWIVCDVCRLESVFRKTMEETISAWNKKGVPVAYKPAGEVYVIDDKKNMELEEENE